MTFAVRLSGDTWGEFDRGRVEIQYNGEWGTVCDDMWDDDDATVVCRMFGYHSGTAHGLAHYGEGAWAIWLDEVHCSGDEAELGHCAHDGWGVTDCSHREDAGVTCSM